MLKDSKIAKTLLEKNEGRVLTIPNFKPYHLKKSDRNQDSSYWPKNRHRNGWNGVGNPETSPHVLGHLLP